MAMSTIVLFARLYVHAHLLRGKSGEILCIRLDRAGRKLMRIEGGGQNVSFIAFGSTAAVRQEIRGRLSWHHGSQAPRLSKMRVLGYPCTRVHCLLLRN